MPQLSNILSAADAKARLKLGDSVYTNTDLDAPQLWLTPDGSRRRNLAKGVRVGTATRIGLNAQGAYQFVGFADGTWLPITHAAIVSDVPPVEPDAKERLVQLLQRDRIIAHQLLAIELAARRGALTSAEQARYNELTARLNTRQAEVLRAGWLSDVKSGFDRTWDSVLRALGVSAVSGLPAIPLAGYALVAGLAVGALVLWLANREPQSVADFQASLDLYNRVRTALPESERKNLDQLITGTAEAARQQAQAGPFDQLGKLVLLAGGVYLAVTQGPKLFKRGGARG